MRNGRFTDVEGQSRSRNVVVEFSDYEAALACYRSAEYQQNLKTRQSHSIGDLIVIEGFDGPPESGLSHQAPWNDLLRYKASVSTRQRR